MKLTTIILLALIFGILLYSIGAISIQKGSITITTAAIKEDAAKAAQSLKIHVDENNSENKTVSILDRIRISITSNAAK